MSGAKAVRRRSCSETVARCADLGEHCCKRHRVPLRGRRGYAHGPSRPAESNLAIMLGVSRGPPRAAATLVHMFAALPEGSRSRGGRSASRRQPPPCSLGPLLALHAAAVRRWRKLPMPTTLLGNAGGNRENCPGRLSGGSWGHGRGSFGKSLRRWAFIARIGRRLMLRAKTTGSPRCFSQHRNVLAPVGPILVRLRALGAHQERRLAGRPTLGPLPGDLRSTTLRSGRWAPSAELSSSPPFCRCQFFSEIRAAGVRLAWWHRARPGSWRHPVGEWGRLPDASSAECCGLALGGAGPWRSPTRGFLAFGPEREGRSSEATAMRRASSGGLCALRRPTWVAKRVLNKSGSRLARPLFARNFRRTP